MAGDSEESFDNFFSICGLLGGIIFPLSVVPQLWKTFRSKSAADLSYFWQGSFLLGATLFLIYSFQYKLWPIFYPMLGEISFMLTLTSMKIYFDNWGPNSKKFGADDEEEPRLGGCLSLSLHGGSKIHEARELESRASVPADREMDPKGTVPSRPANGKDGNGGKKPGEAVDGEAGHAEIQKELETGGGEAWERKEITPST